MIAGISIVGTQAASGPDPARGPWIPTSTGRCWRLLDPSPEEVDIRDIAAGLAAACRYAGQLRDGAFLSVAEHSWAMLDHALDQGLVRCREDALEILLHDASEAYLGDIATPLKAMLPEFRRIEEVNQAAIRAAFGLEGPEPAFVKDLDLRIVLDERRHFVQYDPARPWPIDAAGLQPLGVQMTGHLPAAAAACFLEAYRECERMPSRKMLLAASPEMTP